jgi:hypothetical protein
VKSISNPKACDSQLQALSAIHLPLAPNPMNHYLLTPEAIEATIESGARMEILILANNLIVWFLDWGHSRMEVSFQDYQEWRNHVEMLNELAWREEFANSKTL